MHQELQSHLLMKLYYEATHTIDCAVKEADEGAYRMFKLYNSIQASLLQVHTQKPVLGEHSIGGGEQ